MYVNDLRLPDSLQQAINSGLWNSRGKNSNGRWMKSEYIDIFRATFPQFGASRPSLYTLEGMQHASMPLKGNDMFWKSMYLGRASSEFLPGNIDPDLAIFIGEPEPDSPMALDYRTTEPSVVMMLENGLFLKVADSIEEFLHKLGMH